jgi:hypothetical protein
MKKMHSKINDQYCVRGTMHTLPARVARSILSKDTKAGKIYQTTKNCTKLP